jgi:N4-(beta-N-acetylglucosaminyl)-L-asparaginase
MIVAGFDLHDEGGAGRRRRRSGETTTMKRRTFLKTALFAGAGSVLAAPRPVRGATVSVVAAGKPVVLCTWNFGASVTETAYAVLAGGGSVLDAVERAVRIPEDDPAITSVGRGGMPDRDGHLTLDAAIMDGLGNCGSVVFLEHILHPISVARLVMEKTPHVMLAGEGALQFALENGFKREDLLGENAKRAYREWLTKSGYATKPIDRDNHDTIGLLALDGRGGMAGACTTSGAAWKMRGRVGDSPLVGAGL